MNYIVVDLEFNQDFASLQDFDARNIRYPFEIIQIGAIKLDAAFNTVGTFNRYIKPTFYKQLSPFITELTSITIEQLISEEPFPSVYQDFIAFIGDTDAIFCIWGMADIKEIFRNIDYHQLNNQDLPRNYINIQPYTSKHLGLSSKKLLRLEHAVSFLQIPTDQPFHDAFSDAHYTTEIFKKVYHSSISPTCYNPSYIPPRPQLVKKQIDFEGLIQQFEKMYDRAMTQEEQSIIKLSYKMGKTHQFLK